MSSEPLFDLLSFGRRGPGRRDHLSPGQIEQISRTTRRVPEVVVRVLPKPANTLKSVSRNLNYIRRYGDLELEDENGKMLGGDDAHERLVEDWDLELDALRSSPNLAGSNGREPPRLIHKIFFSMPPGTHPDKVLGAVRNFCREEFALKHRYVMVLHTDEPHPHVHVSLKAISEEGRRLNIKKPMLAEWRMGFAKHLRALGVPANATQRYVRGETSPRKSDGIYRASLRGDSTHVRDRVESVARELAKGNLQVEPAKAKLLDTRKEVRQAWQAVSDILIREGQPELARQVEHFAARMPSPMTEREWLAAELVGHGREPRARGRPIR
jgi:hypothetical protein